MTDENSTDKNGSNLGKVEPEIEITPEMVTRIVKACGPSDHRFESDRDFVERVIFYLAVEMEASGIKLPNLRS